MTSFGFAQSRKVNAVIDSIIRLRQFATDTKILADDRVKYGIESLELAENHSIDSSILKSSKVLSILYLNQGKYELYKELSLKNLNLSEKIKDSVSNASARFNLAQYYYIKYQNDSAYHHYTKALKLYQNLKNSDREALILTVLSDIQETEQDYIGSEENAVQAIKLYSKLPKNDNNLTQLYRLNNLLGIISLKLGSYQESINYHDEAEKIANQIKDGYYKKIFSINNRASAYRKLEDFEKALQLYKDLREEKSKYNDYDPTFYPLIIDNIAYTKLIAGHTDYEVMEQGFKEAYRLTDSLNDPITKLAVSIDLSKFYLQLRKKDSSLKYVNIAYKIAKETSSNEILLDAIKVLSKLKSGEEGKAYLEEHIALSDSLLNVERNVRNKFARIEFETDKIEEENERITMQRKWLLIISGVLLLTLFLLYIIITQRNKNRELQFEKDQQKVNEEIYNLMLSQQDKVDEARAYEKKRISQEMHDGVLGRLFGTRLSLDSLNFSEGKDAMMSRANYISELKTIEEDIRKISHDLNTDFVSGSNFMAIVSELIDKQTKAYRLKSHFEYADDLSWEEVSNKTKINLYRIIQEGLQNIYKHAEANEVEIGFKEKNGHICLTISDDGKGFDVHKSKKGIGLKNINNRVSELDGQVTFDSQKKKGTTVRILIPYKN